MAGRRDAGPGLNPAGQLPRLERALDVAIDQVRDHVDHGKADEENREVDPRFAGQKPGHNDSHTPVTEVYRIAEVAREAIDLPIHHGSSFRSSRIKVTMANAENRRDE